MKKRKTLLLIIVLLVIVVTWIIEPLSFNPFSQVNIPEAESEINLNYEESLLAVNNQLQSKANEIINEHLASCNFLRVIPKQP